MGDKRIKYRYKGYLIRKTVDETGIVSKTEMYIGDTYAISKAKAISNLRYRMRGKERNSITYENYGDAGIIEEYDAKLA